MSSTASPFNQVGASYRGFRVTRYMEIEELHATLIELEHEGSGAQVMHVAADDPENLFCLSFQTVPKTSNGVAHILEHTVLCGSEKFPVKDPFFTMIRRSLNTFMNALTGSDFTCYPAASQVPKDFYNLLDVYIDAVFRPHLNRLSFLQEGHRLEFSEASDPSTPLKYKGVVFNEMKGALSSPEARAWETTYQGLFPDLTYGINSGGDPKVIPELSYEELLQFHRTYYHPSRCLFFFYGDMPLEGHLDFIEEQILSGVEKATPLPSIPLQKRHSQPVYLERPYPLSDDQSTEGKAMMSLAWLTCPVSAQKEILALSVLETVLMGNDASPLKRALLKSGLCKQAVTFMDDEITEMPVLYLMKGCREEDADKIEQLILDTLAKIAEDGVSQECIESALHQVEIHRTEITGDGAPFGLTLFMRSALLKQHGVAPERGLRIHSLFEELHEDLQNPEFLKGLIKKHFLDNPHRVRVLMRADHKVAEEEAEEEKQRLQAIRDRLSEEEAQAIVATAAELEQFQMDHEDEDLEVLPKVTIDDVPQAPRDYPLQRETVDQLDVLRHEAFTNHMCYAELSFDLPELREEQLSTMRIYSMLLGQLGCGKRDYHELLEFEQANTGSVDASLTLNMQAQDWRRFRPALHIKGKALQRKTEPLFELLRDLLTAPRFDEMDRIKEILTKHHSVLESALTHKALKFAVNQSASRIGSAFRVSSYWFGLPYLREIRRIVGDWDVEGPKLVAELEVLREYLADPAKLQLVITADAEDYQRIKEAGFYGLSERRRREQAPWKSDYPASPLYPQARCIASPVAFNAHAFGTVSYVDPDAAGIALASFIFDNRTLHKRIREQGGAYGGGSAFSPLTGKFYFFSYRDPNIAKTMAAWQEAVDVVLRGDFDNRYLEEAKIEMVQALDSPVAPGSRGATAFAWWQAGLNIEMRQNFRNRILSMSCENVQEAVQRQIVPGMERGTTVSFAGRELVERENEILKAQGKKPLVIESV